jgi:hypothetical protein
LFVVSHVILIHLVNFKNSIYATRENTLFKAHSMK